MSEIKKNRIYQFEEFHLDAGEHLLLRGDKRVSLSPRTFALLVKLVENAGHLLKKETLLNEVWKDSIVEEGNLNRTISNLRKALGEKPYEKRFIETVPRLGYRFIAPVYYVENNFSNNINNGKDKTESKEKRELLISGLKTEFLEDVIKDRTTKTGGRKSKWFFPMLTFGLFLIVIFSFWEWRSRLNFSESKLKETNPNEPIRLTDNADNDSHPRWTADGRIRFFRTGANRQTESLIMDADGSNQSDVKDFNNLKYGIWSPDSEKVIFAKPNDKTSYYLANADGSNEIALPFFAGNFDWSFDSKQIVYQKTIEQENSEIFIYFVETGESRNITNSPSFEADPSFSPDSGQVAFVSNRDENVEIYVMNADGSDVRRLTNHLSDDSHPVFSPDGTQIAFTSDRENENADAYLINSDGSGTAVKLTDWKTNETVEPGCWSADGTRIAFFSDRNGKDDIYVVSAEAFQPQILMSNPDEHLGSPSYSPNGKQVVYQAELSDKSGELRIFDLETGQNRLLIKNETADFSPDWSSGSEWIVFQNRIGGNTEICLIKPDGSGLKNLTNNGARDVAPAWSPFGDRIVFTSNRDGYSQIFQLYLMNEDGSNQHRIYSSNGISAAPAWSPDGRQIVFANDKEENRTGNFEIFIIEPETGEPEKRLTFRRRYDTFPAFSPDGMRIVFVSEADGNSEIYSMNRDGTGLLRVTRNAAEDVSPQWSPDGKKIIFSSNRSGKFAIYEIKLTE
jgi:Tol biopolymer transport system component/DNA-binding winged helix-turn-helix (wHTH) protein